MSTKQRFKSITVNFISNFSYPKLDTYKVLFLLTIRHIILNIRLFEKTMIIFIYLIKDLLPTG